MSTIGIRGAVASCVGALLGIAACVSTPPMPGIPTGASAPTSAPRPALTVTRNVWMDPNARLAEDDLYNPGELIPQVESELAVDPTNPNRILASAVYFGLRLDAPPTRANARGSAGVRGRTLASLDGGRTWTAVAVPPFARYNLRVAYSRRHGDAYRFGSGGMELPWIDVQRSDDKGLTWTSQRTERTVEGFRTIDTDQGNIVVDNWPESPYYGRIYLAPHHYRLWFNDARGAPEGWQISRESFTSGGTVLTSGFEVLRDGTVALAFREYVRGEDDWELYLNLVLSHDGGKTFTPARRIVQLDFIRFSYPAEPNKVFYSGVGPQSKASFVTDPSSGRFYCAFVRRIDGRHRIFVTSSKDQGVTWSTPVLVSPGVRAAANQYQVRAAVNEQGELGVVWLDTRNNPGDTGYDLYFALSDDNGQTFREVRVSDTSSTPAWDFNQHELPFEAWTVPGFDARRHLTGGDYIGLRADPAGDFIMTWPDARNARRPQMYFSRVAVNRYDYR